LLGTTTILGRTRKLALPKSPLEPVTVTVYAATFPSAVGLTVNWPERTPDAEIEHVYVVNNPAGVAGVAVVHVPASKVLNPVPDTCTEVPATTDVTAGEPEFGESITVGATPTVNPVVAESPAALPWTVTV
jgi:hypothetical protein